MLNFPVNGEISEFTNSNDSTSSGVHDGQGWVTIPYSSVPSTVRDPALNNPTIELTDGIAGYIPSLLSQIPNTDLPQAEASFGFNYNVPELTMTFFAGMDKTVSRVYETSEDFFVDRDGDGAIDGHFTVDYDHLLIGVDINNDHVADYVFQII